MAAHHDLPNLSADMLADLPSPTDEDLARQVQVGSMQAFEVLVSRYEQRIYAFVSQSCRNGMDAAEITQETFVKAYQAISQFDSKRKFAPWLFTIARRKCVDHFRAILPTSNDALPELSDLNDPAKLLAVEDERRHLWALARRILPDSQFDSLWLHYVEDMSLAEVAKILRRPQTYVKVLLFRARKALAERLKPTRANTHSPPQTIAHAYEIPVR
jgi:RNA polymerase sigma-70 factor (ECF subfamily)